MLRLMFYVVVFFGLQVDIFANRPVLIIVRDEANLPLPGATIQVVGLQSGATFATVSDFNGLGRFEDLEIDNYKVNIRFIGYLPLEQSIDISQGRYRFEFQLQRNPVTVEEVTVVGRRPMVRQEGDRMIIDPAPVADISTNTLEVLEATPGLFVDPEGGIFLGSGAPAAVHVNGREQRMSPADINNFLRTLPPNSVQQIEVVRNPSARHSAESTGGIINIVLKQGVRLGRSGSFNAGMNQGEAGNRFAGFNINQGGDNSTRYLNLNFNRNGSFDEITTTRQLAGGSTLGQVAESRARGDNLSLGYGVNFDAGPRLAINYDGRANMGLTNSDGTNLNNFFPPGGDVPTITSNLISNETNFITIQQDIGLDLEFDTLGSGWKTMVGYSFNRGNNLQNYITGTPGLTSIITSGEGENINSRHFLQLRSDILYRFANRVELEGGVMATFQEFNSDARFFTFQDYNRLPDATRDNSFTFREHVTGGYLQAMVPLPWQIELKTGLRVEHTFMEGLQTVPADTSFVVNRADLFPYLFLSRRLGGFAGFDMQAFIIYRRTIGRPAYQLLSPAIRYVDQFLYETGNPGLDPQFTDNIEANISIREMPIFAIGQNITRNIFSQVVYNDEPGGDVAVRTYDNLGESRETYFRVMGAIPPGRKYFFAIGAQYSLNQFDGFYQGEPLYFQRGSWRLFSFQMFNPNPNTRITLSGFMMTNGLMNFHELETFGQMNMGFSQWFMDRRLSVTVNLRDVLRTMDTRFRLNQGATMFHGQRYADNQRVGITVRYNFGLPKRPERPEPGQIDFDLE